MDFGLTEQQKSLRALVKEFCQRERESKELLALAEKHATIHSTREELIALLPLELFNKAFDVGIWQLPVPEKYEGGGFGAGNWSTMGILAYDIGYWGGPVMRRYFTTHWKQLMGLCYAPQSIQDEFFPSFMKDRKTWVAVALTEPDHGSDVIYPYDEPNGVVGKVHARQDGDYWVINGDKQFSTGGGIASWYIVAARTAKQGPLSKSMSLFFVPPGTSGISLSRIHVYPAFAGANATVALNFDNVRVHKRYLLAPFNNGYSFLSHVILPAKNMHWLGYMGICKRIYEDIRDYAKTRIQGGVPIIKHGNIAVLVAEADALLQQVELFLHKVHWEIDQVNPASYDQIPIVPAEYGNYISKKAVLRLMEIGLEVYGGIGMTPDMPFSKFATFAISAYHGGGTALSQLVKASRYL